MMMDGNFGSCGASNTSISRSCPNDSRSRNDPRTHSANRNTIMNIRNPKTRASQAAAAFFVQDAWRLIFSEEYRHPDHFEIEIDIVRRDWHSYKADVGLSAIKTRIEMRFDLTERKAPKGILRGHICWHLTGKPIGLIVNIRGISLPMELEAHDIEGVGLTLRPTRQSEPLLVQAKELLAAIAA